MANPYEMAARSNKVDKLIAALDAELGRPCTEAALQSLINMTDSPALARAMKASGIKPPSQLTVDLLVERIRERDKIASSRA